jgi:hypothetical protein
MNKNHHKVVNIFASLLKTMFIFSPLNKTLQSLEVTTQPTEEHWFIKVYDAQPKQNQI